MTSLIALCFTKLTLASIIVVPSIYVCIFCEIDCNEYFIANSSRYQNQFHRRLLRFHATNDALFD